jgi:hypothetical protein
MGLVPDSRVEAIGVQLDSWRWVGEVLEVTIEAVQETASWRLVVGAGASLRNK